MACFWRFDSIESTAFLAGLRPRNNDDDLGLGAELGRLGSIESLALAEVLCDKTLPVLLLLTWDLSESLRFNSMELVVPRLARLLGTRDMTLEIGSIFGAALFFADPLPPLIVLFLVVERGDGLRMTSDRLRSFRKGEA